MVRPAFGLEAVSEAPPLLVSVQSQGKGVSISAGAGAVANGEFIGISIAAIGPDNGLTVLASSVRITTDGVIVCGGIIQLPVSVAV